MLASFKLLNSSGVPEASFPVSPFPVEKLERAPRVHFNDFIIFGDATQRQHQTRVKSKVRCNTKDVRFCQELLKATSANRDYSHGKNSKTGDAVAIGLEQAGQTSSRKFTSSSWKPASNAHSKVLGSEIRNHSDPNHEQHPLAEAATPHPYTNLKVGPRWREIQGEKDWHGLLEPMDKVLAGEIMRNGDFAQATYDAFDQNPFSKYCGSCLYKKQNLFRMLGLHNRGYVVTNNIYCTADIHIPRFFRKPAEIPDEEKWSQDSNWMGFVAVCTSEDEIARMGRRDIVVAWRGTVTELEWIADLDSCQYMDPRMQAKGWPDKLRVERGFLSMYLSKKSHSRFNKTSASEQVMHAVSRLVEIYKEEELSITVTGHSMGGALAALCAYEIAESKANIIGHVHGGDHAVRKSLYGMAAEFKRPGMHNSNVQLPEMDRKLAHIRSDLDTMPTRTMPVTVYSFAAPRVGNLAFRNRLKELNVKVLRVVNKMDLVPLVPGLILNEKIACWTEHISILRSFSLLKRILDFLDSLVPMYVHVGEELEIDVSQSPFLKPKTDPSSSHNLEAYLHQVEFHGEKKCGSNPELYGRRDLALVNKGADLLKAEHRVPPYWFQEPNKGLVKNNEGRLVMHGRQPNDVPETEDVSQPWSVATQKLTS